MKVLVNTINKLKKTLKPNYGSLTGMLVLCVLSFILYSSAFYLSKNFLYDNVYDFMAKITAPKKLSKEIVVVAIDDQSLEKIGRWPWKRTLYTDIFEYLENRLNSRVIAFDSIITSYGNKEDDEEFLNRLSKLDKVISGIFFSRQKSYFINYAQKNESEFLKKHSLKLTDRRTNRIKQGSEYLSCSKSLKEIVYSRVGLGSVLSYPDKDGVIRKSEPVFYYKERYFPSLALAVYNKINPNTEYFMDNSALNIKSRNKSLTMPLISDERGSFSYIKWYNSGHNSLENQAYPYKTISAWKIIESYKAEKHGVKPIISQEEVFSLKNKVFILGVTSTALNDIKSTPISGDYPGVYIQASLIENLLNGDFLFKPLFIQDFTIAILIIMLSAIAIQCLSAQQSSIILVFSALLYFSLCLYWAYPNNIAIDPVTPIILIFCTMLVGYAYKYFIEEAKKSEIRSLIAKYVSKDILEAILKDKDSANLGGKHADITVLFVDIRNFTSISDSLPPEEVSSFLNEYFSEMIPVIFKNHGTVNKFMGDALLIIFGAPLEDSRHPHMAVKCAVEMLEKLQEIQTKWQNKDKPPIEIGIGISSGIAFVGNIGADERHEYTAIGNTVNTANRLESFNKIYKTSILISESTYNRVYNIIEAEEVDSVAIARNSEPIKIYELKKLKHNDE